MPITPGNWIACTVAPRPGMVMVASLGLGHYVVTDAPRTRDEHRADLADNARAIAVLPDMVAALRLVEPFDDEGDGGHVSEEGLATIRALLAKIDGEG